MVSGSLLATLLCFEMPFLAAIFNLGKIGGPVGADSDDVNRRTSAGIIRQPRPVSAPRRGVRVWVDGHRERDQEKLPQEHARFSTPPHRPRLRVRLRAGYRPPFRVAPKLEKIGPLSQEALAEQSGLSLWHHQDVEAMRRKGLRLSTIERIARALGVPVWRLLQAGRFPETKRPRGKTGSRIKRWDTG